MNFTAQQQQAISARGNIVVMAGAGTGKTRTLVERCLDILLTEDPPVSLDEILMVTFTEAAAAEMRRRIRLRLEEEQAKHPREIRWRQQLALFDTAHIGTLHGFCLKLIRRHFYELGLDPQLSVLAEEETRLLMEETLDSVFGRHYSGNTSGAEAAQELLRTHGRGSDQPIRALILKLHHYTQTQPDPAGWYRGQTELFSSPEPLQWRDWLRRALTDWAADSLAFLDSLAPENELAGQCAGILRAASSDAPGSSVEFGKSLEHLLQLPAQCPRGKKTTLVQPLATFFADAEFLLSLTRPGESGDPLAEDWNWTRKPMAALLGLAQEFRSAFADAKRELGVVDFHDLEQHCLRLLRDPDTCQPTPAAMQWRQQLRFIFVDEYQDINAAQDRIIQALSREGSGANRFLVGDVKQSIYRFRLANPGIFQAYAETWRDKRGTMIPLTGNFRSREGILEFVNSVFGGLMRREVGGLNYDSTARLEFGAPQERLPLSAAANAEPCVEFYLRIPSQDSDERDETDAAPSANGLEQTRIEKEARMAALRIRALKTGKHPVWDESSQCFRPVEWRDMALLLRSPANKAEHFAKEFSRLGIPLTVARSGFYDSMEILDLLSLLQMLDNPLSDIPTLAVLHSPLAGFTVTELAIVRLAATKVPFWTALQKWHRASGAGNAKSHAATFSKVGAFLLRFARWRRLARQVSLSRCLEAVLAETCYSEWLLTQSRGEQRRANVSRLMDLARRFDQFQRQGLFRFLRFIEAQQAAETEPEVPAAAEENAVRLMSIHQSKGLEFPVVVAADLSKPFNTMDLTADIILDEQFGLSPQIKPPHHRRRYPSLPCWLAKRRQKRELLGEELRLLYVALTRARDLLILTATISPKKFGERWQERRTFNPHDLLSARSYADWLGVWFASNRPQETPPASSGKTSLMTWTIHDDDASTPADLGVDAPADDFFETDFPAWNRLRQRIAWQYPFDQTTRQPAKTSVSALRRQSAADEEDEAHFFEPLKKAAVRIRSDEKKNRG